MIHDICDEKQWREGIRHARELALLVDKQLEGTTLSETMVAMSALFAGVCRANRVATGDALAFLEAVVALNERLGDELDS